MTTIENSFLRFLFQNNTRSLNLDDPEQYQELKEALSGNTGISKEICDGGRPAFLALLDRFIETSCYDLLEAACANIGVVYGLGKSRALDPLISILEKLDIDETDQRQTLTAILATPYAVQDFADKDYSTRIISLVSKLTQSKYYEEAEKNYSFQGCYEWVSQIVRFRIRFLFKATRPSVFRAGQYFKSRTYSTTYSSKL